MINKNHNKNIGNIGENIAVNILKENNYKIITTNFFTQFGEIDIIAIKDDDLIFVEVKTRLNQNSISPKEAVNYKKQGKIKKSALLFMNDFKGDYFLRFDVFEIFLDKKSQKMCKYNHIEDAF